MIHSAENPVPPASLPALLTLRGHTENSPNQPRAPAIHRRWYLRIALASFRRLRQTANYETPAE
jgi:hypothetical protein